MKVLQPFFMWAIVAHLIRSARRAGPRRSCSAAGTLGHNERMAGRRGNPMKNASRGETSCWRSSSTGTWVQIRDRARESSKV